MHISIERALYKSAKLRKESLQTLQGFEGRGYEDSFVSAMTRMMKEDPLFDFQFWSEGSEEKVDSFIINRQAKDRIRFSQNHRELICGFRPGSLLASGAALETIDKSLSKKSYSIKLLAPDSHRLPWFKRRGYDIEYVSLGGDCRLALNALKDNHLTLGQLKSDYAIELCSYTNDNSSFKDILALMERAYFQRKEFSWFFSSDSEKILTQILDSFTQEQLFLVMKKETLVGLIAYRFAGDPMWFGLEGRLSFCLDPSIQGLGFCRAFYHFLLKKLLNIGVYQFSGDTAHDGIIHLGHIMHRPLRSISLSARKR